MAQVETGLPQADSFLSAKAGSIDDFSAVKTALGFTLKLAAKSVHDRKDNQSEKSFSKETKTASHGINRSFTMGEGYVVYTPATPIAKTYFLASAVEASCVPMQCSIEANSRRPTIATDFIEKPVFSDEKLYSAPHKLPVGSHAVVGYRSKMEDRTLCKHGALVSKTSSYSSESLIPDPLVVPLDGLIAKNYRNQRLTNELMHKQPPLSRGVTVFDFVAIFDGHGGTEVSQYLYENLLRSLTDQFVFNSFSKQNGDILDSLDNADMMLDVVQAEPNALTWPELVHHMQPLTLRDMETTIKKAFNDLNDSLPEVNNKIVGSTAVTALISPLHIIVANVGDSRAVLSRGKVAYRLSRDHKPDEKDEEERINKCGGKVYDFNGKRVQGLLAMTRAFGDTCLRKAGINADPEVTILPRSDDDDFLILACDGLWDVISDDEACRLVQRCVQRAVTRSADPVACCQVAATVLTKAALHKGSGDNISVVVVDLRKQYTINDKETS